MTAGRRISSVNLSTRVRFLGRQSNVQLPMPPMYFIYTLGSDYGKQLRLPERCGLVITGDPPPVLLDWASRTEAPLTPG